MKNTRESSYFLHIPHISLILGILGIVMRIERDQPLEYLLLYIFVVITSVSTLLIRVFVNEEISKYFFNFVTYVGIFIITFTNSLHLQSLATFISVLLYYVSLTLFTIKEPYCYLVISTLVVPLIYKLQIHVNYSFEEKGIITVFLVMGIITMIEIKRWFFTLSDYKLKNQKITHYTTLRILGKVSELHDIETNKHLERVETMIEILLQSLKENKEYKKILTIKKCENIKAAAFLHDIGKIGISDSILNKSEPLTADERDVIHSHALLGSNIVKEAQNDLQDDSFFSTTLKIVRSHHERWDGTGYPDMLEGYQIPLCARIMAIVDVYDALRSDRPYKRAFSKHEAVSIIQKGIGSQFDPKIGRIFLESIEDLENSIKNLL